MSIFLSSFFESDENNGSGKNWLDFGNTEKVDYKIVWQIDHVMLGIKKKSQDDFNIWGIFHLLRK